MKTDTNLLRFNSGSFDDKLLMYDNTASPEVVMTDYNEYLKKLVNKDGLDCSLLE